MSVLALHAGRDGPRWGALLAAAGPELDIAVWPATTDPARVRWAACWHPPPGWLAEFPALEAVFALGAGVDRLLARPDLPAHVAVVRLHDAGMADQLAEYALLGVLLWQRRLLDYAAQQARAEWKPLPPRLRGDTRVTVLGLGAIGGRVATTLAGLGYRVAGWSRTPRTLNGVRCTHGPDGLDALLAASDVLVNLLPSTAQTRGLLDATRLDRLPPGAVVVNAARGDQLDAEALRARLDDGRLAGALLDVFATEPLPSDHPLWRHPRVTLTPHVAGITLPDVSAAQIVDGIRRLLRGDPVPGRVDRERGY